MSLRRSRLTCQNWGPDRRGNTKLPLESGMIADDDNHPGCSRQRSTFNVRLQSAIRCIPTCKGRRQTGVDEIQQLDHWWFCRGRRTKRGRVPSSRHGRRVREGGRVRACSWFLLELDAREKARGESGSVPASQEGAAARASRRTRVPQRADCAAHLSLSGSARDCAAIAECAAHGGGSGGAKARCCRRLIEFGEGAWSEKSKWLRRQNANLIEKTALATSASARTRKTRSTKPSRIPFWRL